MFTEQPAPSPPTQVQPQQVIVAVPQPVSSPAPPQTRIAPPESIPSAPLSNSAPAEPTPLPSREPEPPSPQPAVPASQSATSTQPATTTSDALSQRRREVEQTLIELTSKARAQQKEQQQQQAATDAAKYANSDSEAATKAANNPSRPADVRAKLLNRVKASQAKAALAKGTKQGTGTKSTQNVAPQGISRVSSPGYPASISSGYSIQPILPADPTGIQFSFWKLMGKNNLGLTFPLTIAAAITSNFGWRTHPITGSPRFHRGIDLGAPYGTPIVAAKAGVVQAADFVDGYGLTIILRHNNTQETLYAHLSQILVKPGDTIQQGQLIGQVGSTGFSTGPHLHFEVHQLMPQGWVAFDPAVVLAQTNAIAQRFRSNPFAAGKVKSFNLSASGLLNINSPSEDGDDYPGNLVSGNLFANDLFSGRSLPSNLFPGSSLFSGLTATAPANQQGMLMPFTLLTPAVPEFGWLLPSLIEDLFATQASPSPLPDQPALSQSEPQFEPQSVSFQPLAALTTLPKSTIFNPSLPTALNPETIRVATTQPLARLSIAQSMPGVVNLEALKTSANSKSISGRAITPSLQSNTLQTRPIQPKQLSTLKPIKLTDNRTSSTKLRPDKKS